MNTLYLGDCLNVLRDNVPDESVDLIYNDPPFNSKRVMLPQKQEKNWEKSVEKN